MTTQEMHIEIDLELQQLNSQINKNLEPQEKDWFLNNEVRKFIEHRTIATSNDRQSGFESTSKRIEDIKELIRKENRPVEVNSRGEKFITLPSDYFEYIRFDSFTAKQCSRPIPTVNKTIYRVDVPLTLPTNLGVYKLEIVTAAGTTVLFDSAELPANYIIPTATLAQQRYIFINALRIRIKEALLKNFGTSVSIYWERADNNDSLDSFTIESDVSITSVIRTIETDVITILPVTRELVTYPFSSTPLKGNIRVINEEFFIEVQISSLSKSKAESPIASLKTDRLEIIDPISAVIGSVDVTYLCKPTMIDLLLNSNLNMSTKNAKEIVGSTVRYLKGILQDPNYATYARENVLIE